MKKILLTLMATASMAVSAYAADIKPAVIFDLGGKFDKSFNEAAYNGAEKFKAETGVAYRDFEIANAAQREQALRKFADDGDNPVVVVGFSWEEAIKNVAPKYPNTKFAIIDGVVKDLPNVKSIVFKEQEGSYLAGVMAAVAAKSNKVGFVGGMDIPLIHKFACGYIGGVKSVKPDAEVFEAYTGSDPSAWNDPVKGGEIAKSQISQGADVIYHAAGGTGVGVLQAAAEANKLGIGVDSNQNAMQPGKVLTSMLKRVDVAVYNAFMDTKNDKFVADIQDLGLKEQGVDVAMDDNNKPLITPEIIAALDKARKDVVDGTVQVHDYMSDEKCPY